VPNASLSLAGLELSVNGRRRKEEGR
jgi:hypothetical protein